MMFTSRLLRSLMMVALVAQASVWAGDAWHVAWTRDLPDRQPMWQFNKGYPVDTLSTVVEAGDLLLVGTTADASLRAYRRSDGSEAWRYDADGAIRWSPSVAGDAVFVGADDGVLVCLNRADGAVRWRYRPGAGTRQCIGHGRIQSSWPITTTCVMVDGVVYGAAGYFIDDGIWTFAVDAATGTERWLRRRLDERIGGRVVVKDGEVGFAKLGGGCGVSTAFPVVLDAVTGDRKWVTDAKGTPTAKALKVELAPGSPLIRLERSADGALRSASPMPSLDIAAAIAANAAKPIAIPATWKRFGPLDNDDKASEAVTQDRWRGVAAVDHATRDGVEINIAEVWGEAARLPGFATPQGIESLLVGDIEIPENGVLFANASADWHVRVMIDGATIIDTLSTGNGASPKVLSAQTGSLPVSKGTRRVSLRVRPGKDGYLVRLVFGLAPSADAVANFPGKGRASPPTDPTGAQGILTQALQQPGSLVLNTSALRLIGLSEQPVAKPSVWTEPSAPAQDAAHVLTKHINGGWALVAGLRDGALCEALALAGGAAHLVAVDPDPARVAQVRQRLRAAGLLSSGRVQVLCLDPDSDDLPQWIFSCVVSENATAKPSWTRLLRPHGGMLVLANGADPAPFLAGRSDLSHATLDGFSAIRRAGAIAGSADWSHDRATAANASGLSEPEVRFPLAVHWYGSPADSADNFMVPVEGTLEGQVMQPQAHLLARGVWLQQGIGRIVAIDQYTGRALWKQPLPVWYPFANLGIVKGFGPWNNPISEAMPIQACDMPRSGGFNMSCSETELFICAARELRVYDIVSGAQRAAWAVPKELGDLRWGTVRLIDDLVVATLFSPDDLRRAQAGWDGNGGTYSKDRQRMRHVVALDMKTGALRWKADAERGFLNQGLAVGGGRAYVLDLLSDGVVKGLHQSNNLQTVTKPERGTILAFELSSGKKLWEYELPALLTDIVYDTAQDLVILPSRFGFQLKNLEWTTLPKAGGKSNESPGVLVGVRGADGKEIYRRSEFAYREPYSLVNDRIVQRAGIEVDSTTGQRFFRTHPVTGASAAWTVPSGGCTWIIQSRYFSANRSTWTDQENCMSGTLTGDSGCTPTNIPSGGLVNISNAAMPRFGNRAQSTTRTLAQRQPLTAWSNDLCLRNMETAPAAVTVLGLLPGAPGNRADDQRRWWMSMRSNGWMTGMDDKAPVKKDGAQAEPIAERYEIAEHRYRGAPGLPAWVGAWGFIAPGELRVPVVFPSGPAMGGRYRLTFIVAEPLLTTKPGQRVFSISCDGTVVAATVDPLALAKAPRAGAIVQAEVKAINAIISVRLTPNTPDSLPPVIGGILVERVGP